MTKNLMTLELSNHKVTLLDGLTWGQKEDIQAEVLGSEMRVQKGGGTEVSTSNVRSYKYKLLEIAIVKITDEKDVEVPFSKDWMRNLSVIDGDKLYSEAELLISPKE